MSVQTILALGALVLLTLLIININRTSLNTEGVMYDSNFGITASSLASSIIEDASKKRFDNVFYDGDTLVSNVSSFTPANTLGVDSGEVATDAATFDDFDDYDGYTQVNSSMPTASFSISCIVTYINRNTPDVPLNTQSWHKKLTVKVWSPSMTDTIKMSQIFSYWTN